MMITENALICLIAMSEIVYAFGGHIGPRMEYDARLETCVEIAAAAEEEDLPVSLVVSLAKEESGFTRALVSKAGAHGPLQIIPRYHCPSKHGVVAPHKRAGRLEGCDLITDGVRAVKWFRDTYAHDWPKALCHWNSGTTCLRDARAFAHRVIHRHRRIETQLRALLTLEAQR